MFSLFLSRGGPIIKNVSVTDINGKRYAPTYIRRAKGLVKAGRARWSDGSLSEIQLLVSPAQYRDYKNDEYIPDYNEKDDFMETYNNDGHIVDKNVNIVKDAAAIIKTAGDGGPVLSVGYILGQMEKIRADSGYITEAFTNLGKITTHPPTMNAADLGASAKAEAIGDIVKAREATNQKLLSMYERMYDEIKPTVKNGKVSEMESMMKWATEMMKTNHEFGRTFGEKFGDIIKLVMKAD